MNAHRVGTARHLILAGEKALVCLDGGLGQVHAMRTLGEILVRLVEANVTVAANAEELQVRIASLAHYAIVLGACLVRVGVCAVGHVRVGKVDVDLVEEVLPHEVVIALRVLVRKAAVLIQVVGANL